MYKTKHKRGLCCFFKCQQRATVRYATPGHNQRDNEEQIFCEAHWEGNRAVAGPVSPANQWRVSRVGEERKGEAV